MNIDVQQDALKKTGNQIEYSINNYKQHGLKATNFKAIVIAGLGGSGIGGQLVRNFFSNEITVPVVCVADYHLPAFVDDKTLVIAASYSGNTEETISIFNDALERKCTILCMTTGGKLADLARANEKYLLLMESGFQPRMALGFSLTYLLQIFGELLDKDVTTELKAAAGALKVYEEYENDAHELFQTLKSKAKTKFIVIADAKMEAVAIRFAQQIQENAKHECFVHTLPEMSHNVIESYYGTLDSVFFMLHTNSNARVSSRFDFLQSLLEVQNHKIVSIELEYYNIVTLFETIYRLDWLSLFIADERRVDALNVPNITSLKEYLD